MAQQAHHGFTLIELVIAIAIVGILTAIAIPAYTSYVLRGQLVSGINGLSATRAQMEQYYQDNRTYLAVTTGTSSYSPPCSASPQYGLFSITCSAPLLTANTYTLVATGSGNVAGFVYTIDQNNNMQTTSVPATGGWGATPAACWITKPGMTC